MQIDGLREGRSFACKRWRGVRSCALGVLLAALPCSGAHAHEFELRAEWAPSQPGMDAEAVRAGALDQAFSEFDPSRLLSLRRNPDGAWVRLRPRAQVWPEGDLSLLVRSPGFERVQLHRPDGATTPLSGFYHPGRTAPLLGGRLGFDVAPGADPRPLLLYFEPQPTLSAAVTFALRPRGDAGNESSLWLVLAGACFGVMAAMAVIALCFAVLLRDATFVIYAAYVLTYAMIFVIQTGFAAHPLNWSAVLAAPSTWARGVTGASVMFACLFLSRFADLRRYAPGWRRWVLALGATVLALMLLSWLPVPALQLLGPRLINPLLMLGAGLLLIASVTAFARGSRYAGVFLLGWLPLLALTAVASAQHYGVFAAWTWAGDAAMVAGAFEALVLSLGLASRTLDVRRERDEARRLARLDPLTGLLNRRAFDEHYAALAERCQALAIPLSLVFLDLDHFKRINDYYGHRKGDELLVELAEQLRRTLDKDDLIGRYGGEEFVLALPHARLDRALDIAERIRRELAARTPSALSGGGPPATLSAGVAQMLSGETPQAAMARADAAMYGAKQAGRNRVQRAPAEPQHVGLDSLDGAEAKSETQRLPG